MLKCRSADKSCVKGIRFGEKSVRMIKGKASQYKLFWIGNDKGLVGADSLLAKKWIKLLIKTE